MPGHMNVLLAEANVPYEQLKEMDQINDEFKSADVALVVGANDVVNPAAHNSPGSPIYGMPILNAEEAKNIVFMKRSMRPGFAGIDNELLYDPKTVMLFGDAKDLLMNGRSVPFPRRMSYCSGVDSARHSASVFEILVLTSGVYPDSPVSNGTGNV